MARVDRAGSEDLSARLLVGHGGEPPLGPHCIELELAVGRRESALRLAFQLGRVGSEIAKPRPQEGIGKDADQKDND